MDESRFFRFVWRFNSLVLCVAGILAIVVLSLAGFAFIKDITRERSVRGIVNIDGDQAETARFQLGQPEDINGSCHVMVALHSDQKYAQSCYSKSSHATRNYLFIDLEGPDRHWLFDTNDFLVIDAHMLSEKTYGDQPREIRAILYIVAKQDTNGDSRLTAGDSLAIALTFPDGRGYKEILNGIDALVGYKMTGRDELFLIYERNGIAYSANVVLSDFTMGNQGVLPMVTGSE